MRDRPNGEYDDARSRSALLRIYANAGRFTDAADADGSYRLSALALARKNCNAADYAKAISFLAGGDKDSVMQKQIENGMFKVFEAAGLDGDKIGKAHIGDNEEAELAALCGDVVQLAGNLPPAAFRHEIEGMCERLKKSQSERERIRYMERYFEDATRDIESISMQMRADTVQREDTTAEEAEALIKDAAKKEKVKESSARTGATGATNPRAPKRMNESKVDEIIERLATTGSVYGREKIQEILKTEDGEEKLRESIIRSGNKNVKAEELDIIEHPVASAVKKVDDAFTEYVHEPLVAPFKWLHEKVVSPTGQAIDKALHLDEAKEAIVGRVKKNWAKRNERHDSK